VVHCTAWGEGDEAVLRYLARYPNLADSTRLSGFLGAQAIDFRGAHGGNGL
jgi:hypothetical protein